jgi:hypothetical protein
MLGLAQRHPRHHAKRQRLLRGGDDVSIFFPRANDDRAPIQVLPLGELEVSDQTTADAHSSSAS